MKISKVSISNFRSIGEAHFDCDNFNIFVGQNNAGKTNFFEAVEWFFNGTSKDVSMKDLHPKGDTSKTISVKIEFTGALHGAENMRNEANKTKMLGVLNGNDKLVVERSSEEPSKRKIIINEEELAKNPAGFDKAFNDFLPKFEYIHTKQYFDEVARYSAKTPVGIMLSTSPRFQ